jgi:hypothetical protein
MRTLEPWRHTYTISDLAKEFDLTTRAMRFYEDMGLLQPERRPRRAQPGLQRARPHAPEADVARQASGPVLTEAKEIIDLYDSPRDTGVQLQEVSGRAGPAPQATGRADGRPAGQSGRSQEHEKEARALLASQENQK